MSGPGILGTLLVLLVVWSLVPRTVGAQAVVERSGSLRVAIEETDAVGRRGASATALELTYRWGDGDIGSRSVSPQAGLMLSSDGSAFGYVGLHRPLPLSPDVVLVPSFSAGAYQEGTGLDLGSVVQFRSGIEVRARTHLGDRISIVFYHLSNGGIGMRNPGVEVLGFGYTLLR